MGKEFDVISSKPKTIVPDLYLITCKFIIKIICNILDSSIFIDVVYFYDEYDKILTVEVNSQKPNFRRLRRFYIYVYVSSRLTEGKKLERTYVRQV